MLNLAGALGLASYIRRTVESEASPAAQLAQVHEAVDVAVDILNKTNENSLDFIESVRRRLREHSSSSSTSSASSTPTDVDRELDLVKSELDLTKQLLAVEQRTRRVEQKELRIVIDRNKSLTRELERFKHPRESNYLRELREKEREGREEIEARE